MGNSGSKLVVYMTKIEMAHEVDRLRTVVSDQQDFLAGSSLCDGCQAKREERRILATPRIQVEEERDELRAQLAAKDTEIAGLREHIEKLELHDDVFIDAVLKEIGQAAVRRIQDECSAAKKSELDASGEG